MQDRASVAGAEGAPALGQEVEYEIAAAVIGAFPSPFVVDVGVEHGSFVDMALRAGASRVVGFEPLPRHVEHLERRFADTPAVEVHPLAISRSSGIAVFHIATDAAGNELDYHHTLSDLGDTESVIRSRRAMEVRTASLADLVRDGTLPARIDLLKVDTDGHDLAVLEGLGDLRPSAIMAEYWDTLPESSGTSEYSLSDLAAWARASGYPMMMVVRRHGRIESLEVDAEWTVPGDWGNAIFLRADFPFDRLRHRLQGLARARHEVLCEYVSRLTRDAESKEAEIRRLHDTALERDAVIHEQVEALSQRDQGIADRDVVIRDQAAAITELQLAQLAGSARSDAGGMSADRQAELMKLLEDKEAVIVETQRALRAYKGAFILFSLVLVPLNFAASRLRRAFVKARHLAKPRLGMLVQHEPRHLNFPLDHIDVPSAANAPRITVVTPSYNQADFIERTIRSVLDQGYPNLEYRVQDGASTDGTAEILRRWEGKLSRWDSRADSGQSEAINRGFDGSTGEIMAWLNSDDVLFPGALAYVADYFTRHPEVDVIYGHRILIDEEDRQIGRWILPAHSDRVLSWADFVPQETLFWRRRIWDKAGGHVDESFRFAMDWDLLLRFRDAGARFARVPRFLGGFRIHGRQKTSAAISDVGFREMDRLRERVLGRVPNHAEIKKALVPYVLRHLAADARWKVRDRFIPPGAHA